jgi:hypothetical protein
VDFAYCDPYPTVKVAIETKWIGRTRVFVEDLIWDMIRLEMISAGSGAECIFMIGGKRKQLEVLFESEIFAGPSSAYNRKPIMYWKSNVFNRFSITPINPHRVPLLRGVFKGAPDIDYPQHVVTRRTEPFPKNCGLNEYQVYSWKVTPAINRMTFRAKQSPKYWTA